MVNRSSINLADLTLKNQLRDSGGSTGMRALDLQYSTLFFNNFNIRKSNIIQKTQQMWMEAAILIFDRISTDNLCNKVCSFYVHIRHTYIFYTVIYFEESK
jgi:hypothetical protein